MIFEVGEDLVFAKNNFKVVHLSTSHTGGAGIAARRLHKNLLEFGVSSEFIALERGDFHMGIGEVSVKRFNYTKFLSILNSIFNNFLNHKTFFSITSLSSLSRKKLISFGPPSEVIFHIHNWFNFLNFKDFEFLLEKGYKLVFTLHDQRIFTGGCHYSLDCRKFETGCTSCPHLNFGFNFLPALNHNKVKELFRKYNSQIIITAPSKWIQTLASQSSICKDLLIEYLPNFSRDAKTFSNILESKVLHGETQELILGVASMDKNSYLKGREILKDISASLKRQSIKAKLVYLSDYQNRRDGNEYFWNSIEYLLVPSVVDNSPNVIHEAKGLGIPILATNVGGIGELLNPKYDFLIDFNEKSSENFVSIIKNLPKIIAQETRLIIMKDADDLYLNLAEKYHNLYCKFTDGVS